MGRANGGRGSGGTSQRSTELENLISAHYQVVYNLAYRVLARREDAEDIAQQTFVQAFSHLGELRPQNTARRWLCRVASNLCVDELRRRARAEATGLVFDDPATADLDDPDQTGTPSAVAELHETRLAVWRAVLGLPPEQRLALALREWHHMRYAEIANAMQTSVAAVESLLFRARQGLRRAYTGAQTFGPRDGECDWVLEHISASIDGELGYTAQLRIDAHLAHCQTCQFAARELAATARLYALIPLIAPAAGGTTAGAVAVSSLSACLSSAGARAGEALGTLLGVTKVTVATAAIALATLGVVGSAPVPGDASPIAVAATVSEEAAPAQPAAMPRSTAVPGIAPVVRPEPYAEPAQGPERVLFTPLVTPPSVMSSSSASVEPSGDVIQPTVQGAAPDRPGSTALVVQTDARASRAPQVSGPRRQPETVRVLASAEPPLEVPTEPPKSKQPTASSDSAQPKDHRSDLGHAPPADAPPVIGPESARGRPQESSTATPRSGASQGRAAKDARETVGAAPADNRSGRSSGHVANPHGGAADPATPAPSPPPKTTDSRSDSSRADPRKSSATSPGAPSNQLPGASSSPRSGSSATPVPPKQAPVPRAAPEKPARKDAPPGHP